MSCPPSGPRLVTFFAVMYYAGLRPEEAINLRRDNVILPQDRPDDEDWGELHIRSATPDAGGEWTDDGSAREMRQLKHRAEEDSRVVPVHPELTWQLRDHLANFATAPDGRLFGGVRAANYRRSPTGVWIRARQLALTVAEQASPLARRLYNLRHACLSTWLSGDVYRLRWRSGPGQRQRPAADLRQVRCGSGRARQAEKQRSIAAGLTRGPVTPMILDLGTYWARIARR